MQLAARIGTMARRGAPLPYKRRLAWIGGTGTQHIITDVIAEDDVGVSIEAVYIPTSNVPRMIFGVYGSNNRYGIGVNLNATFGWWNVADNYFPKMTLENEILKFNFLNSRSYFVGGTERLLYGTYNTINTRIAVFNALRGDTGELAFPDDCLIGNIGVIEISKGQSVVSRLVPVMSNEEKPCYYDELRDKFFYNQGTGDDFEWGEL